MMRLFPLFLAALAACSGDSGGPQTDLPEVLEDTADTAPADTDTEDTHQEDSIPTDSDIADTADIADTQPVDPCAPTGCGDTCGHEDLWTCEPLFSGSTCSYSGEGLRIRLLAGSTRLDFDGGLPSRLIVHGKNAFPVLVDDQHGVTLAGAYVGRGRVLVLGHEGPLKHRLTSGTGFAGLWQNAASWLTGQSAGQTSGVIGLLPGFSGLATDLASAGWTTRSITTNALTTEGLADLDLLVMDAYGALPTATLTAIHTWIENGGALLTGAQAWWWATTNTDAARNFPGNALLAPSGITIVEAYASDAPYLLPASAASDLDQASVALDALTRERNGCAALSSTDRVRAATAAGGAIDALPLDSDFLASAMGFNDAVGPVIPGATRPLIPAETPLDALAARLQVRLALDAPPETTAAHPAGDDFPGPVPAAAPRISRTLTLDGSYAGVPSQLAYGAPDAAVWRSTGLYAAPGELIEVTVPARVANEGLTVQIGAHTDTLWHHEAWHRMPRIVRETPITSTLTRTASGFGGPIYLTVPVGSTLGSFEVTVAHAVAMPTFKAGADWSAELAHAAPWAELIGTSFILHVPTENARQVTNPTALMNLWDEVQTRNAWLAGLPTTRPRAERFAVDRQISAGWMHSGYPMMAHLETATEVLTLTAPSTSGAWGPLHELGHNHQNLDWVLPNTTESSVNLWSVYISEEVLQLDRALAHPDITAANRAARIAAWRAGTDRDWSVWMALETYLQLQERFGWDLYHRLFARYFTLADRPSDDEARLQTFITLASLEAGRDLSAFFAAWGLIADTDTRAAIAHLPAWLDHPLAR